ncbi:hypothetical protein RSAG8_05149, partial [Rhizoctonia solani AG-8 WAC10335]
MRRLPTEISPGLDKTVPEISAGLCQGNCHWRFDGFNRWTCSRKPRAPSLNPRPRFGKQLRRYAVCRTSAAYEL